jgi:hypothetical protein
MVEQFWYVGFAAACGPERVEEAVERCRRILDEAGDDATVAGRTRYSLARLEATGGLSRHHRHRPWRRPRSTSSADLSAESCYA